AWKYRQSGGKAGQASASPVPLEVSSPWQRAATGGADILHGAGFDPTSLSHEMTTAMSLALHQASGQSLPPCLAPLSGLAAAPSAMSPCPACSRSPSP